MASQFEIVQGVTETLLDYCQLLDEKRLDEFAELFTTDCTFIEGQPAHGRDHVRAKVRKLLLMFDALSHHLSNIRVRPTSETTAEASSYIYAWHQLHNGEQLEIWGRYIDQLKKVEGRWLIHHRQVQTQGWKGLDALDIERVPQAPIGDKA